MIMAMNLSILQYAFFDNILVNINNILVKVNILYDI